MSQPLVIFGAGEIAQVAHHCFMTDSPYEVAGFAADRQFLSATEFCGKPLVAFEDVTRHFPTATHSFFVAVGYAGLNDLRRDRYLAAKNLGYPIASYVSSRATVLNDGKIGENCLVLENNTIQPFAEIGNNVTLWSGNHIGHHSLIRDNCFLASHIVVSGGVDIGESCFIGVNATLRDHIRIGSKCVIGAGALLLADAEPGGVYMSPATERSKVPSSRLRKL